MSHANQRKPEADHYSDMQVIFKYTDYDYRIALGTVENRNSISWDWRFTVSDWETAKKIIDMYHATHKYPAIEINLEFNGR